MDKARRPQSSDSEDSIMLRFVLMVWLIVFAGCATTTTLPPTEARHYAAAKQLLEARASESPEKRAGHYLQAAASAGPLLGEGAETREVRDIYNTAVAEPTVLLRSG